MSLRHPVLCTLSPLSLSHRLRHRHTIGNTPQYTVSPLRFLASTTTHNHSLSHRLGNRHTIVLMQKSPRISGSFVENDLQHMVSLSFTQTRKTDARSSLRKRDLELVALLRKMTCNLWSLSLLHRLVKQTHHRPYAKET